MSAPGKYEKVGRAPLTVVVWCLAFVLACAAVSGHPGAAMVEAPSPTPTAPTPTAPTPTAGEPDTEVAGKTAERAPAKVLADLDEMPRTGRADLRLVMAAGWLVLGFGLLLVDAARLRPR